MRLVFKWIVFMVSMNRSLLYILMKFGEIVTNVDCVSWRLRLFLLNFLGTGEVNVVEAESLLEPYLQQFPNVCLEFQMSVFSHNRSARAAYWTVCLSLPLQGSLVLFYHGRIELLKGNVEEVTYLRGSFWGPVCLVELCSKLIPHERIQLYALDKSRGEICN